MKKANFQFHRKAAPRRGEHQRGVSATIKLPLSALACPRSRPSTLGPSHTVFGQHQSQTHAVFVLAGIPPADLS